MSAYATIDTGHKRTLAGRLVCGQPRRKKTKADVADGDSSPNAVPGLRRNMAAICAMTAAIT